MATCPYCCSETPAEALACPTCRRELYLVRQLQQRIADLQAEVDGLRNAGVETSSQPQSDEATAPPAPPSPRETRWSALIATLATPLIVLLAAHWLVLFVYDTKVLYLRLLAIAIPLPFGVFFGKASSFSFPWKMLGAFGMAVAAVFGMSAITGWLDQVPVLPQNMAETREFIEFAISIGLSFTTGLWLEKWARDRADVAHGMAPLLKDKGNTIANSIKRINDFGSAIVALGTTAFSIYTGLKSVIGN